MKLIDLRCSSCGAIMKANPELKKVICNYCGNEMLIDDESRKIEITNGYDYGYEAEKGKIKAQEELLQELKEKNRKKKFFKLKLWIILFVISVFATFAGEIIDDFFRNCFSVIAFVLFVCMILAFKDYLASKG